MSGHSHYATIHRQKEIKDAQRGAIFSKMARAISIAIKAGGNADPSTNYKLRMAIELAKGANMPKTNIDRILDRAEEAATLEEVTYEGFGPSGVAVVVEAATDNRNRTGQEVKNIFERVGGRLAGPGSVLFNFEPKGLILVKKEGDGQEQTLKLIDIGVEEIEDTDGSLEVYVPVGRTMEIKDEVEKMGFTVISAELTLKPKNVQTISDSNEASKVLNFLEVLGEHEDVQKVYANIDIPNDVMTKLNL